MNLPLFFAIFLLGARAVATPSQAQNASTPKLPATAQSVELRPAQDWNAFRLSGADANIEVVPSDDARFDTVLRASNTRLPDLDYNIQIIAPTEMAIKKGDVMLAQFWMRTIKTTDETGQGTVSFVF